MSDQPAASSAASSGHLVVQAVLRTDVGLVRSENQDFGIYTTTPEERESHPGGRLLVVADGMGGHRGGATASRIAGETVKAQYLGSETTDIATALQESLARANARIYAESQVNPELRGMGTTTSALAVRNNDAWLAHVGDSRIYLVRDDSIRQLTDDHSLVASMVREGLLTVKEAEVHPRRNVLQRSMGVSEQVDIDVVGPIEVREGDTFILCSDGLHGLVKEAEMKEVAKLPIDLAADEYLRRALERGAPDNVTVIVARIIRAEDYDETLAYDARLDETQPIAKVDVSLFDDTVRDSAVNTPAPAGTEPIMPPQASPALAEVEPRVEPEVESIPATTLSVTPLPTPLAPPQPEPATTDPAALRTLEIPLADVAPADPAIATTVEPEAEEPQATSTAPAAESPLPSVADARRGGWAKWLVVLVIALVVAGGWMFWSHQRGASSAPAASSTR